MTNLLLKRIGSSLNATRSLSLLHSLSFSFSFSPATSRSVNTSPRYSNSLRKKCSDCGKLSRPPHWRERRRSQLRNKLLRTEFALLASSFIANNNSSNTKLFFRDIEFRESQSSIPRKLPGNSVVDDLKEA